MSLANLHRNKLFLHWTIVIAFLITIATYIATCHLFQHQFQTTLSISEREFIRTLFYVVAIILLPLTNLLRFILLRLNQTMFNNTPATQRYLLTVTVSQILVHIPALFGLIIFSLGDDFNSLYIFSLISLLGVYIQRPRQNELAKIIEAIDNRA